MILLPKITRIKLEKYAPVFSDTLDIDFPLGKYVLLGGNGNGKTTILQSIIYCIAGPADGEIEINKSLRWNHKYFEGRLNDIDTSFVEVEYELGKNRVIVRRGFKNSNILGFKVNDMEWEENPSSRQQLYDQAITELGNYGNDVEFRYIVHKLLYLPETRPNLAWDTDVQVRLLMIMFGDIINEKDFREKRARLKETDSKMRHTKVAIGKADDHISNLLEYEENSIDEEEPVEEIDEPMVYSDPPIDVNVLVDNLRILSDQRRLLQKQSMEFNTKLSIVSEEIGQMQQKVLDAEQALILDTLKEVENKEVQLTLYKLVSLGLCPSCGTKAQELQARANRFIQNHCCALCGNQEIIETPKELNVLQSKLTEKVREKLSLETQIHELRDEINDVMKSEHVLQAKYDDYRLSQPVQKLIEYDVPVYTKGQLEEELKKLNHLHAELKQRCIQLENELDEEYEDFRKKSASRIEKLSQLYSEYASAFLGIDCELIQVENTSRLLTLTLLVPKFLGKEREVSSKCSEAQRFFLDIALRISLIHLTGELSGYEGSFVCETPENALDMSYVRNVAKMFNQFSMEKYSVILTSNIQPNGLAGAIMSYIPPEERSRHILNLLSVANLSQVQNDMKPRMEEVLAEIIKGEADAK